MSRKSQRAHHIDGYNERIGSIHRRMRQAIWILVGAAVLTAVFAGLNNTANAGGIGSILRVLSLMTASIGALTFVVVVVLQLILFLSDGTFGGRADVSEEDLMQSYEQFEQFEQPDEHDIQ